MSTDPMSSQPFVSIQRTGRSAALRACLRLYAWCGCLWRSKNDEARIDDVDVLYMDDRLLRDIGAPADIRDAAATLRDRVGRIGRDVQPW